MAGASRTSDRDDLSHLLSTEGQKWKWNGTVEELKTFLTTTHSLKIKQEKAKEIGKYLFKILSLSSAFIEFWPTTRTLRIQGNESEKLKKRLVEKSKGSSQVTKSPMQGSTTESEEIKSKQDDINVKDDENKINEAKLLAFQFMSENPSCIRAIPYEREDAKLTMRLYIDTNGEKIPEKIKSAAYDKFPKKNYEVEFENPSRRRKIVTRLQSSEKQKAKDLADLSKKIEENLDLFENRMNVTAVQASYKVTRSIEKNVPCVTVYVLGKGKIPAGETDIKEIKEKSGDIFNKTEFDVAEGYYKMTTGPSLEGHAMPLQGGVGIGVRGVDDAGTLGGFLEDKKGNVYILSNEHVLHPVHAGDQKVIVQPSKFDYKNMREKAGNNIRTWTHKIENIPEEINKECRSFLVRKMAEKIENSTITLSEIEQNPPRKVGKYVTGLERNVNIDGHLFYVDAAIATLDESEFHVMNFYKTHIEDQINRCPLYGFETNKYWKTEDNNPPNGEIIDFANYYNRMQNEPSESRFMKIGRTTGFTDEVLAPMFLRPPPRTCDEHGFSWAYNCLAIRKRVGSFSERGDSGSLVFDQDGRAWGLVFGKFSTFEIDLTIVSPLFAIVDALEREANVQELRLWRTPNDEDPNDKDPNDEDSKDEDSKDEDSNDEDSNDEDSNDEEPSHER